MYYEFCQQVVELDKSLVKKCITRPYDPGITNPKAPETCSEILVFVPKSQKFQPEGPSVVVCSQNGWNYSVSVTSYLEVARPFCKSSQIQLTGRSDNVNAWNNYFYLKRNLFIPDPTTGNTEEVSEVNEEDNTLFDEEAIGERRVKKEELGTKGDREDEVISFIYMFVLVEIENGLQYIYPI